MNHTYVIALVASSTLLSAQPQAARMADDPTLANFDQLATARQRSPVHDTREGGTRPGLFEDTPPMVDIVLSASTSNNRVVAPDTENGTEQWSFDQTSAGHPKSEPPAARILSPTGGARTQSPGAGAAPKDASGKDAFDRICAACHGPEARGDAGPRLVPFGGSLDALRAVVREGSGQMPPVSTREMSDDSVALVHEYLLSLSR